MHDSDKNLITLGILLIVTSLFSISFFFRDFKQTDTVQIKEFPRTIGVWTSQEIPLTKEDLAILETDNAFVRMYKNPDGQEVLVYIVYSQTNHKVSHPPEICYTGNGIAILEKTSDSIPVNYNNLTIKANRLLLRSGQLYQISYYWFKVGNTFTSDYWKQQTLLALNTLFGKREGSALIRISADIINNDQNTAIKEVKEFTNLITPLLFKNLLFAQNLAPVGAAL